MVLHRWIRPVIVVPRWAKLLMTYFVWALGPLLPRPPKSEKENELDFKMSTANPLKNPILEVLSASLPPGGIISNIYHKYEIYNSSQIQNKKSIKNLNKNSALHLVASFQTYIIIYNSSQIQIIKSIKNMKKKIQPSTWWRHFKSSHGALPCCCFWRELFIQREKANYDHNHELFDDTVFMWVSLVFKQS